MKALLALLQFPEAATRLAASADALNMVLFLITAVGGSAVFLAALYFIWRYRRRDPDTCTPRTEISSGLEYSGIALLLAIFCASWVVGFRQYIALRTPPRGTLDVYVTAKQWMWKFTYPNGRSDLSVLTVPVHTPIKLHMTSRDVIHSFFVPAFRVKHDVLPRTYTSTWFQAERTGDYPILCSEYCGLEHSNMLGTVRVVSAEAYTHWQKEAALPSLKQQGQLLSQRYGCRGCHSTDGTPARGPTWLGMYNSPRYFADGSQHLADEAYLIESIMHPHKRIVKGYADNMPEYWDVLPPSDLAAMVEFIKAQRSP